MVICGWIWFLISCWDSCTDSLPLSCSVLQSLRCLSVAPLQGVILPVALKDVQMMFWGVVMEECHYLFVRKEVRENQPLAISCSSFCLKQTGRQRSAGSRASDERWCRESFSSGVQFGARDNTQKYVITLYLTCMDFMHCVWLFFVSFVVQWWWWRSDTAQRSLIMTARPALGQKGVWAKARHRNKDQWDGLKKLLNEAGVGLLPQDSSGSYLNSSSFRVMWIWISAISESCPWAQTTLLMGGKSVNFRCQKETKIV